MALGQPSRWAIFQHVVDVARGNGAGVDVATLTALLGLNHTTVRAHVAALEAAGLITAELERRSRPGRPRVLYRPGTDASRWRSHPPPVAKVDAVAAELAGELRRSGFGAEVEGDGDGADIVLRACPYAALAATNPEVCEMHRALAEGVVESLAPSVTVRLQTAEPGTGACVLRLARRA